jgi:hypothetical protein
MPTPFQTICYLNNLTKDEVRALTPGERRWLLTQCERITNIITTDKMAEARAGWRLLMEDHALR